jgi:DNA invertase Pin-like site-specific DNA recombinase
VSTKEQTENLSLPTQLRACEEYCRRQDYEILERFHEGRRERQDHGPQPASEPALVLRLNKGRVHSWWCST